MKVEWRHRVRNIAGALLILLLGTALPLTLTRGNRYVGGSPTLWILWCAAAAVLLVFVLATDTVARSLQRFPLRWVGFSGGGINPSLWGELELRNQMDTRAKLHKDLERIWEWQKTGGVTLALLRSEADTIAAHFREGGYGRVASRFEIRLNDDATLEAVNARLRELELELHRLMLWGWGLSDRVT